jgi:hypothetical protein
VKNTHLHFDRLDTLPETIFTLGLGETAESARRTAPNRYPRHRIMFLFPDRTAALDRIRMDQDKGYCRKPSRPVAVSREWVREVAKGDLRVYWLGENSGLAYLSK